VPPEAITAVSCEPLSFLEQLHADNWRTLQESHALETRGTPGQLARWCAGHMPEAELCAIARHELFKVFAGLTTRRKMTRFDVHGVASACHIPDSIKWSTEDRPTLRPEQWENLEKIRDAAGKIMQHPWMRLSPPESVQVSVRGHRGECANCGGFRNQQSALVTITWAQRNLSREYVL
jgi:hypothetical protein